MTAMLSFNPDATVEENVTNMTDELSSVKSGEVTKAIRDSEINGVSIKKNDYLGIIDGDISIDRSDLVDAAAAMVDEMLDEDSEIITVMYGRDTNKRTAKKVVKKLQAEHDDLEFEIHDGGQPVYYFLISVE
jgi:dihydroxyacetone kinase-like predicted kinase